MAKKDNNEVLTRPIKGFNPVDYLEKGTSPETTDTEGNVIPGEPVSYLPAWVRQKWYNQYCFEHEKIMPLTTKLLKNSDGQVIVEATLFEIIEQGTEHQLVVPVQTGYASAFMRPGDTSTLERCETCAKARCLGAAGFSIREEKSTMFDEGDTPVDGNLLDRKNLQTPANVDNSTESDKSIAEKEAPKKKRGRPRKKTVEPVTENSQEQTFFDIPNIDKMFPKISQNTEVNKNASIMDDEETLLDKCLRSFFPYGPFRGQQVVDVIDMPKFKEYLDNASKGHFDNLKVAENLYVNDLLQVLSRYLNTPSTEDRSRMMKVISAIRDEDEDEE